MKRPVFPGPFRRGLRRLCRSLTQEAAFLLGAAVFLVFALVLEQRAHQLILGGPAGGVSAGGAEMGAGGPVGER